MSGDDKVWLTRKQAELLMENYDSSASLDETDARWALAAIREQLEPKRVEPTPGPWSWHFRHRYKVTAGLWPKEGDSAIEICTVNGHPDDDGEANARLIAAAPRFLAWATSILAQCSDGDISAQCDTRDLRAIVASVYGEDE